MNLPQSKLGFTLAGVYLLISAYFIFTQGLFGESFIAVILGLPWSMVFASFEYGNANGALLYILILGPIILNAYILYWIGSRIQRVRVGNL